MQIHIHHPNQWMQSLAEGLQSNILNDVLTLNPKFGKGTIKNIPLMDGLKLNIKNIELNKSVRIIKSHWQDFDYQPIIFHYSDSGVEQWLDGKPFLLGRNTPKGIVIPSHQINSQIHFPANVAITVVAIVFSKSWLSEQFEELLQPSDEDNKLQNLFFSQQSYFIYESISPQILRVMEDILKADYPPSLAKVYFKGKVFELLSLLFHKLINRTIENGYGNLNNTDVENLLKAEKLMLDNIHQPPKINDLAKRIGMSESKLKRGFKEIFGESIYQYTLQHRMTYAKSLLDSRRFNVSEVGTQVGYSNLAHFAKAFRKQFSTSPSEYLGSLRK